MSYQRELDSASRAARAAGDLLRREFHRPGGPLGTTDHAVADPEAEKIIRDMLLPAFPEYGYLGEELGPLRPAADGRHTWVVDPNDGTSGFMRGFRGPAVSIALLREGMPVLGVVYAYCAPDDAGDFSVWAEGCGPLIRNGKPASRQWPAAVSNGSTVLLSQYADLKAERNALSFAPARFRGVASIAYRLALVACGDADATISRAHLHSWDIAAGHALLLGAGGQLYDASGRPVTYAVDGACECRGCIGGSPFAPAWFSERLGRKFDVQSGANEHYGLCWPAEGRSISDAGILSRAQSCLLGQIAGDSLGSLVEFQTPSEIASRFPGGLRRLADGGCWGTIAGQPTDDSEMALMLARSIVDSGRYGEEEAARAYVYWFRSGPFDIGGTTARALAGADRSEDSPAVGARRAANRDSQANGALMRVSPLCVYGALQGDEGLASIARADAALTHPHPVCADANAVFAVAAGFAIQSGGSAGEVYMYALDWASRNGIEATVLRALQAARTVPPNDYLSQQGWVLVAFQNAFYQLLHARTLEEGVVDTVMRGGDTDTNAAIAGALLGAVHGRTAMPGQWVDRVLTCRPVEGLRGVRNPRQQAFWPVDVLILAEELLFLGASAPGSQRR